MEYPHRPYLKYLLSRRMTLFEVLAECEARLLLPPSDVDVRGLVQELGAVPSSWVGTYNRASASFKRWLRDTGVLELWKRTSDSEEASRFLYAGTLRSDFEALILVHGEAGKAREALALKHGDRAVPSLPVLESFQRTFWAVGDMTRQGLFDFVRADQERKKTMEPALRGEMATTYGLLGLRQRVEAEELYDNIIALANHQVQKARQSSHLLKGGDLLGLAALSRQAMDAVADRAEIHTVGGQAAEDLRKEAVAFRMRAIPSPIIIGIDELMSGQIPEADDTEEREAAHAGASNAVSIRKFIHPVSK